MRIDCRHLTPYRASVIRTGPLCAGVTAILLAAFAQVAAAQVTYRNTDIGRPLRVEDATALDRYALDVHISPVTFAWGADSSRQWSASPGLSYGLLPRTQIDIAIPLASTGRGTDRRTGIAGLDIGALYNFNAETTTFPAFAMRGSMLLPVGEAGPASAHPVVAALATRALAGFRVHLNGSYAFRDETLDISAEEERRTADAGVVRWLTGIAVDRTLPRRSMLLIVETSASQPLDPAEDVLWNIGAGLRYQLTPRVTADLGISARLTGPERLWSLTFGLGRVTAVRSLLPGVGPWGGR